jgi:HPt (histidine-containing phosphotransfer) domain-containing protein
MDDYVSKPIQPKELLSVVDRWAGRRVIPHAAAPLPPRSVREEDIFDLARALSVAGGDEEFVDELIALFRESAVQNLAALGEALARGDLRQAAREAHSVRGAAANVGAVAVEKNSRDMELAAREGGVDVARALAAELSRSFAEVDGYFARRLSERGAPAGAGPSSPEPRSSG